MDSESTYEIPTDATIAVSMGDSPSSIAISALNKRSRKLFTKEVDLSALSMEDIESTFDGQRNPPLPELRDELQQMLAGVSHVQTVSVVPSVFLDASSPLAKGIVLLAAFGFGSLQFGRAIIDEVDRLFLGVDPPVLQEKNAPIGLPPRILWAYVDPIKAFSEFQLGHSPSGIELAATAATCLAAPGLFYFLTSGGDPQSSQDVVEFLNAPERMKALGIPSTARIVHGVVSGTEQYSLAATDSTKFGETQRLPLKYALAAKRFEWLEPKHARKLAVLSVCKEWSIRLSCSSLRDELFAVALIDSLEKHTGSEDEATRQLATVLKRNYDNSDVAPGFKSAYILAMHKALAEARIFESELELRLLGLGRGHQGIEHVVYDPENSDIEWAFDGIRELKGEA